MKLLEKVLYFLLLFLFAFIPLYPKFPIFNVTGTFVAIRLEDILISAVLGLWLIHIWYKKHWTGLIYDNIGRAFLLFFFTGVLAIFSGIFLTHTLTPHLALLHFLRRVELMMLVPVCLTIFTSKKRLIAACIVLFVTLFAANVFALGQEYLGWPVVSTTNSEFSKGTLLKLTPGARVNSTFAGHYDLAVFLSGALVFLLALFFTVKKKMKIVLFIALGVSLFVLVLTAARVSFVSVFIGMVFVLILARKKKYLLFICAIMILALAYPSQLRDRFVSTITVNLLNLGQRYEGRNLNQQLENKLNIPTLYYRIASRSTTQSAFATPSGGLPVDIAPGEPVNVTELAVYRSFEIRLNSEWPRAINAFLKNPFTGLGYSSLGLATDNDLLRSLGEVGILGTSAFALILLAIWKRVYQGLLVSDKFIKLFSVGTLCLIIVFLINGTFIDVFEASKVAALFWMILGVNLAVIKGELK